MRHGLTVDRRRLPVRRRAAAVITATATWCGPSHPAAYMSSLTDSDEGGPSVQPLQTRHRDRRAGPPPARDVQPLRESAAGWANLARRRPGGANHPGSLTQPTLPDSARLREQAAK